MADRLSLSPAADDLRRVGHQIQSGAADHADDVAVSAALQLGRTAILWSFALVRLEAVGEAAMRALDRSVPEVTATVDAPGRAALDRSELEYVTALLIGDLLLEDLAWTEIVRRGQAPRPESGGWVPSYWSKFMEILDDLPADPMTGPARFVDITLGVARDQLGPHRNPRLQPFSSWSYPAGAMQQSREASDSGDLQQALRLLRSARPDIPRAADPDWAFDSGAEPESLRRLLHQRIEFARATAGALRSGDRKKLKEAHRLAGFDAPPMVSMVTPVVSLLSLHLGARRQHPEDTAANPN